MRIGFDAKKIVGNLTGIGNYGRGVLNVLTGRFPEHDYLLFTASGGEARALEGLHLSSSLSFVRPSHVRFGCMGQEWWRCRGVVGRLTTENVDVYHGLNNELPWGIDRAGCKSVVTIHDLIFLRYPSTYSFSARCILEAKTRYACRRADRIIAISRQTRADLMTYYRVPSERISVVYQGCDETFARMLNRETVEAVRRKYGLPPRYLLNVSTVEERKNQLVLLRALPLLPADVHVVLVGRRTAFQERLERYVRERELQSRVHICNGVPQADLPALYQGCALFVYPSWYEGFGIPVLEALRSRVPVIAATGSCLEEVGGEAACYCPPQDADGLAATVNRLLASPDEVRWRVEAGIRQAGKFSGSAIAEDLMNVYEDVLHSDL